MKDLKQLYVLEGKLKTEIQLNNQECQRIQTETKAKKDALKGIQQQIKDSLTEPMVTEHALVRYFERELGYNLEEIKEKILPPKAIELIKTLGNGEFPVNGFSIRVRNNAVITLFKTVKEEQIA